MAAVETHVRPKVGVGVFVTHPYHPNKILMGIRTGSTGEGLYALPGGHLEFGEEWEDCGAREALEEADLKLKNVFYATVVNAINLDEKVEKYHYVTIFVQGEVDTSYKSEPENLEPDRCLGWHWVDWNQLPPTDKLFCALKILVESNCYNPFDHKK
ncbi:hypothetical protein LOTGIDRAFT_193681 [Lottia gigantea]|uniref:Nucleotide triphosphate diphosphatase NUDT15 n=1 Tax=Lottia gigantea TaxID=225164 RepID=V4BHH3_LOTGI|nr:hypothetical protein LOTGIDRAFT_193681 [Lottia gigantea]ESO88099.1 hypothetical protein LOTGIDRAFT_193681 [Lottia gigantea]